jgi:hypothetical protein
MSHVLVEVFVLFADPGLKNVTHVTGEGFLEHTIQLLFIFFLVCLARRFCFLFTCFAASKTCLAILVTLPSMDPQQSDPEKSPRSDYDIETLPARAVAFPPGDGRDEKSRPTGVEMRRQMTQEDIRLAAAGYEHLTRDKPAVEDTKLGDVDITEHSLPIQEIESLLGTSFNWVDPAQSQGLTAAEAEERLKRDGPNALTPPKKKSALQKVCIHAAILRSQR